MTRAISARQWNLAAYLDRAILGPRHLWRAAKVYDPEGILSTVPAVATTLLGVLAGQWLRERTGAGALVRGLAWAGVAGLVVGWIWGLAFPDQQVAVDQLLRRSSRRAGPCVALAACYWVIEIAGAHRLGRAVRRLRRERARALLPLDASPPSCSC